MKAKNGEFEVIIDKKWHEKYPDITEAPLTQEEWDDVQNLFLRITQLEAENAKMQAVCGAAKDIDIRGLLDFITKLCLIFGNNHILLKPTHYKLLKLQQALAALDAAGKGEKDEG